MTTRTPHLYVLSTPRNPWIHEFLRWANSGVLTLHVTKCISTAELRAHLEAVTPGHLALLDAEVPGVSTDLLNLCDATQTQVLLYDDRAMRHSRWQAAGVQHLLTRDSTLHSVSKILQAQLIDRVSETPHEFAYEPEAPGKLIAVCGTGGVGVTSTACLLAQGLVQQLPLDQSVLVSDFSFTADLAVLHDASDVMPCLEEFLDLVRTKHATVHDVRQLTHYVEERGYHALLGIHRAPGWSLVTQRTAHQVLLALRRSFGYSILDLPWALHGERETGFTDLDDYHALARLGASQADLVLVVGRPGLKGLRSLHQLSRSLRDLGVAPERIVRVITAAPKSKRSRAALLRNLEALSDVFLGPVLFVESFPIETSFFDGVRFPQGVSASLAKSVLALSETALTVGSNTA